MTSVPVRERVRPWAPWALLLVAVLLVALAAGRPPRDGPPLDPTSTGPLGTKALVDTLRDLGVAVDVRAGPPTPSDTTALVLSDDLDDAGRDTLRKWVEAGGTLVVTDIFSVLNPGSPALDRPRDILATDGPEINNDCAAVAALARVRRVVAPSAVFQESPPGAQTCFRRRGLAWFIAVDIGRGSVVSLGGASALVNANIAEGDNALLAVDLLAPTAGDRVVVVQPPLSGGGDKDLASLIARRVKLALAQLAIAFVVVALWRSRRLGKPVIEPQPVQIEASELVVAVGELMQRARARQQAAMVLRNDCVRWLAEQTGMAATTPAEVVVEAIAARHPALSVDELMAVVAGPLPVDEDGLVVMSQRIESIRSQLLGREPHMIGAGIDG